MRLLLAVIVLSLSLLPARAQVFDTPEDLVETLYGGYFSQLPIDDFAPYLDDALTAALNGRKVGMSAFEALGFDPIVGNADWQPRNFKMTRRHLEGDTAQVEVDFINRGIPVSVTLDLVREAANGWQISHLAGKSQDRTWCTNDIVAAGLSQAKSKP
jgi:hypothetical protein